MTLTENDAYPVPGYWVDVVYGPADAQQQDGMDVWYAAGHIEAEW